MIGGGNMTNAKIITGAKDYGTLEEKLRKFLQKLDDKDAEILNIIPLSFFNRNALLLIYSKPDKKSEDDE